MRVIVKLFDVAQYFREDTFVLQINVAMIAEGQIGNQVEHGQLQQNVICVQIGDEFLQNELNICVIFLRQLTQFDRYIIDAAAHQLFATQYLSQLVFDWLLIEWFGQQANQIAYGRRRHFCLVTFEAINQRNEAVWPEIGGRWRRGLQAAFDIIQTQHFYLDAAVLQTTFQIAVVADRARFVDLQIGHANAEYVTREIHLFRTVKMKCQ